MIHGLNRLFDMSLEGEYTIRVQRRVVFEGDKPRNDLTLASNELKIKIDNSLGKLLCDVCPLAIGNCK